MRRWAAYFAAIVLGMFAVAIGAVRYDAPLVIFGILVFAWGISGAWR